MNKTDTRLLTAAAKAIGLVYVEDAMAYPIKYKAEVDAWRPTTATHECFEHACLQKWNPLKKDRDLYRLIKKLGIIVDFKSKHAWHDDLHVRWKVDEQDTRSILRLAGYIAKAASSLKCCAAGRDGECSHVQCPHPARA